MANTVTLAFAKATLTVAANPANTETVTVGGKAYTFQSTLTDSDGNVKIGSNAEGSIDNLVAAINLGSGAGTAYAASMTRNTRCWAKKKDADEMEVYSQVPGTIGNLITVAETLANASSVWDVSTLAGGSGNFAAFMDDLFNLNQINAEVLFELKKLTPASD